MSASNIISEAERTGSLGDKESLREVLDFLVTEEQLGVTLVSAAIKNAPGTPSEAVTIQVGWALSRNLVLCREVCVHGGCKGCCGSTEL